MLLTILIAIAIPIAFLYFVHWLDLYGSDRPRTVLLCFAWGFVVFVLAAFVNRFCTDILGLAHDFVGTRTAPLVEEVFKSLFLIYLVRRANFTYFVDGAIYGFAAGIGFAVIENLRYIQLYPDQALLLVICRDFSTALMHGAATALTGVALGRFHLGRGNSGILSLLLGWTGAMTVHYTFNNIAISSLDSTLTEWILVAIGLGGVALVVAIILWGLAEERRWLHETLGLKVGVSAGESAVVQQLGDLDVLLAPVREHFGADKRKQVEAFLKLQAQLGLKRKVQEMTPDPKLRAEMQAQVNALREEIDTVRRGLGVYCMSYVRSILPPATEPMWARLGQALETHAASSSKSMWNALDDKMEGREKEKTSNNLP